MPVPPAPGPPAGTSAGSTATTRTALGQRDTVDATSTVSQVTVNCLTLFMRPSSVGRPIAGLLLRESRIGDFYVSLIRP